jgi:uncharacterized protein (DUF3820 family)
MPEEQKSVINEIINHIGETPSINTGSELSSLEETIMPFGRFSGMSFKDILKINGGRNYLEWIVRDLGDKPNLQIAANHVLQHN